MFESVIAAKSGIQTRRQARTWLPEFNLYLARSIETGSRVRMEVIKFQARGKAYAVHVGEDLFGSLYVLRRWFSLTSNRGGSKLHANVDPDEVERLIEMVVARRKAHGYRIIEDGRDNRIF
jgi:hypothetical protein